MINKSQKVSSLENIYKNLDSGMPENKSIKEYVDIRRICNGIDSVFMNLANENILNYVLVILVVRNIFYFKVNFFLKTNDQ